MNVTCVFCVCTANADKLGYYTPKDITKVQISTKWVKTYLLRYIQGVPKKRKTF